jgi:hypothetical protein
MDDVFGGARAHTCTLRRRPQRRCFVNANLFCVESVLCFPFISAVRGAVPSLLQSLGAGLRFNCAGADVLSKVRSNEEERVDRSGRWPQGAMPVSGMPWGAPGGIAG